jgi:NADPH:quinone reductase-like Zn-dependent oxidoreductase
MPDSAATPAADHRMRAVSQDTAGGPEVLKVVEIDRPVPGPTEVLVRVHAAGVNPTDWKTRERGQFYTGTLPPFVLGFDVSGVVEAVGPGVMLFAPGDAVFGMPRFPHPAGAYAEYVTAPGRHFARTPEGLDHVHAAALPLAGLTAWQALVDIADVRPGQRVLVHAAAGGVGHLAVQIAKARGAYVVGTARSSKHDFLRSLGADELVDYTQEDFAEAVHDIDVVVDAISGDYGPRSLRTMRPGGVLVSLLPLAEDFPAEQARKSGLRAGRMLVEPDQAGLKALAALVDAGQLRVEVETVLPLELAGKAHELGEAGRTTGKLVLSVTE